MIFRICHGLPRGIRVNSLNSFVLAVGMTVMIILRLRFPCFMFMPVVSRLSLPGLQTIRPQTFRS